MTLQPHAQIEEWWKDRRCKGPHALLNILGRYPVRVQPELINASKALEKALLDTGYPSETGPLGSYNCRTIGGGTTWSLHAYAVALDIDYPSNPYLRGDTSIVEGFTSDPRFRLTERNVDAVEAIRNVEGEQLWRWLGWSSPRGISDTMHFQINTPPDRSEPVNSHFNLGDEDPQWEPELWRLFELAGGVINPNGNSSQIETLMPWHQGVSVRIPMLEDFELLAGFIDANEYSLVKMVENGLYKWGLELAALRERAYRP